MAWPYEFLLDLSDEEKALRRQSIESHALVAHLSAYAPAAAFLVYRLISSLVSRVRNRDEGYQAVPGSPVAKAQRTSKLGHLEARWMAFTWWMGDDVVIWGAAWGQRDEWILGLAWTFWLLVLCVVGTGNDYLHLTKRFGLVAVSQLPIQYLLALKDLNPFGWIFRSSHEQVNRYHRVLGRIIYTLLILHIVFYNVFFLMVGVWWKRFFAPVVFVGVIASIAMHALAGTAMAAVRRYSYRLFFITHLGAVLSVPPLIFFHASSARPYLAAALIVFAVDILVRKMATVTAPSTLETVPGTDLIKISATLPPTKLARFHGRPGSHVYLSVPAKSRPSTNPTSMSSILFELLFNPFTVASIDDQSNTVTLVSRLRGGPLTRHLSKLSSSATPAALDILGPYSPLGMPYTSLPSRGFDRILLFAGGVGATFALPIYRAITQDAPSAHVKLIWAVRSAADATWASEFILNDDGVELYITGDMGLGESSTDGVEMAEIRGGNQKRPNVNRIVDDAFHAGQQDGVAVLVCGPDDLAKDLRTSVRPWAMKGRRVWWHNESFGW